MRAVEVVTALEVIGNLVSVQKGIVGAVLRLASPSKALVRAKAAGVAADLADCDGVAVCAERNLLVVPHVYATSGLLIVHFDTLVAVAVGAVGWLQGENRRSSS